MTRIRTRLTAAAAAALTGLALTACTADEGGPIAAPTSEAVTTSPAPSGSPSPATPPVEKPVRPAAVDQDTQAGAEAAVVFFLELDPYMQATGDTSEWEAMSHESCGFCAARSEQARQITEAGDTFTGGKTTVSILTTYAMDEFTGIWPIDVQVSESASQITQPDGVVAYSAPASTYRKRVETAQSDGKWVVLGVGEIPEG